MRPWRHFVCDTITLVNVQYRARTLFVEHERAVDVTRRLADDQADLLLKVRKYRVAWEYRRRGYSTWGLKWLEVKIRSTWWLTNIIASRLRLMRS